MARNTGRGSRAGSPNPAWMRAKATGLVGILVPPQRRGPYWEGFWLGVVLGSVVQAVVLLLVLS